MHGMTHYHACMLPIVEDPNGSILCQELRPVLWVEFDDESVDIEITARDSSSTVTSGLESLHEDD